MSRPFRVPAEELRAVSARVVRFAVQDDGSPMGHVHLQVVDGRRMWAAGDAYSVVMLAGGEHDGSEGDVDALIPPRAFPGPTVWQTLGDRDPLMVVPEQREDGSLTGPVVIDLGSVGLSHPAGVGRYPDVQAVWDEAVDAPGAVAALSATDLVVACDELGYPPAGVRFGEDYPAPLFRISIDADGVLLTVDWPGYGTSTSRILAKTSGKAATAVNRGYLFGVADACAGSEVTLRLPLDIRVPVTVESDDFRGALMPIRDRVDADELQAKLQHILGEDFGLGAVEVDDDGDLPFPFEDQQLFLRVSPGDPPVAQLFAVLADLETAEPDADLALRLNDLNAAVRHARVFVVGGQVLVEADLPYDLEPFDLRRAAVTIADHTRMLRPMFVSDEPGADPGS